MHIQACENTRIQAEEDCLQWTVHLARIRPALILPTVLCLLISAYTAWHIAGAFLSFASLLLITASVREYLFPITYTIDSHGARAKGFMYARSISWQEVKKAYRDNNGVKLSTLPSQSRMDRFRGLYLFLPEENDNILTAIKSAIDEANK